MIKPTEEFENYWLYLNMDKINENSVGKWMFFIEKNKLDDFW